jgi:hypothetical protein
VGAGGSTAPPTNVIAPILSGKSTLGEVLACDAGTWTAGGSFGYAWLRGTAVITGATGAGYRIAKKDLGTSLSCRVTLTNALGKATASSKAKAIPLPPCVVPNVKGKTVDAAKKAIIAAGCTAGRVSKTRSKSVPKGRVLTTRPGPKTRKPGRTKITIVTAI